MPPASEARSFGTPLSHWNEHAAILQASLDLVAAFTNFPPTLERVAQIRRQIADVDAQIEKARGDRTVVDDIANAALGAIDLAEIAELDREARGHRFDRLGRAMPADWLRGCAQAREARLIAARANEGERGNV